MRKSPNQKRIQSFEQSVLRALKKIGAENSTVLVAASGGVDSMVLLETIKQWQRTLNLKLAVAYIHHGYGVADSKQKKYRDAAKTRVEAYCQEHGLRFVTNKRRPKGLRSEDDFRKYRWEQLAAFADQMVTELSGGKTSQSSVENSQGSSSPLNSQAPNLNSELHRPQQVLIATAHHADDLVETQLLRLLRGTGSQGLKGFGECDQLEASTELTLAGNDAPQATTKSRFGARPKTTQSGTSRAGGIFRTHAQAKKFIIRPLLTQTKEQIKAYAKANKLKFTQDPTNQEADALRNWVRQKWLKPLNRRDKQKSTNHIKSLAGSLAALGTQGVRQEWPQNLFHKESIHTPTFLALTKSQQAAALATFMHMQQMKNYTKNHVAEILKRLDTNAKELRFRLLGRDWHITAQHISYRRLDIPSE